eukprot:6724461-Pyramimonas_sp.AAC.1
MATRSCGCACWSASPTMRGWQRSQVRSTFWFQKEARQDNEPGHNIEIHIEAWSHTSTITG